jgi:Flp pilus assembly protein TadG
MRKNDRGAAAVELALLLPLLLLILFGIVDFGRMLNYKLTITHAAREGVRAASVGKTASDVTTKVTTAASADGMSVYLDAPQVCPNPTGQAVVVVHLTGGFTFLTPLNAIAKSFSGGSTVGTSGVPISAAVTESCA